MAQKTDNSEFQAKVMAAIRAAVPAPRGLTAEQIKLRDKFAREEKKTAPDWFIPRGVTPPEHPGDEPCAPPKTSEEEDLAVRSHVFFGNDLTVRLSEDAKDYGKRLGDWFEKAVAWDQYQTIRRVAWRWRYADMMLAARGDVSAERGETKQAALADMAEGLLWALEHFVTVAEETRAGCAVLGSESRTGKLLRSMAGELRGHRQDIDTIHDILDRARNAVARGEQQ